MPKNSSAETKNHVLYQIMSTPIRTYPLVHLRTENVFPEDFYRQMLSHLPPREYWQWYPDHNGTRYKERYSVELNRPDDLESIPEPFRSFWSHFGGWFRSDDFRDRIVEKFRPHLRRIGLCRGLSVRLTLMQYRADFEIGPHTDSLTKLISIIFYLAESAEPKTSGTTLYVPKDPEGLSRGSAHQDFDKFEKVSEVPCVPNSMFAFVRTDTSFHGVEKVDTGERNALMYNIKLGKTIQTRLKDKAKSVLPATVIKMLP